MKKTHLFIETDAGFIVEASESLWKRVPQVDRARFFHGSGRGLELQPELA